MVVHPLRAREGAQGAELAFLDLLALPPDVVPCQVDMLPSQRRQMPNQLIVHRVAMSFEALYCPLQIDRVPEDDGRHNPIQTTGSITLVGSEQT